MGGTLGFGDFVLGFGVWDFVGSLGLGFGDFVFLKRFWSLNILGFFKRGFLGWLERGFDFFETILEFELTSFWGGGGVERF